MTVRDDLHRLIDQLRDDELVDARHLLEALRAQEMAAELLATQREPGVDTWQQAMIRLGIEYADRPDADWVNHAEIVAWLKSWGTDDELLPPPGRRRM